MQLPPALREWFRPAPDSGMAENIRRGKSPYTDWVHLLWSIWIFVTPLFDKGLAGYTRTWLFCTLVTYPLFLLLYAGVLAASRRKSVWFALGMVALCFATMHRYPSGMSYFIYGCVFLYNSRLSAHRYLGALIAVNAAFVALGWWLGYPKTMLVLMPAMAFIICTIVMVEHMGQQRDAAWALSQEEVRRLAATAERERIGRDLHDLLGHTLSLITLKLELSRKLFDRDTEAARREVSEAERVARHALSQVRSAVSGIRAADIAAELASARLLLESSGVHLDYELPQMDVAPEIEHSLSLVLREAATNIARHAGASSAKIELLREPSCLHLTISDNGRGGIDKHGNGLNGIGERVRALKGTLAIESIRRQGTTLRISVPVPNLRLVPPARPSPKAEEQPASPGNVSGQPAA